MSPRHPDHPISETITPAERWATIACGWVVLANAVVLTLEILGRKLIATPFKAPGTGHTVRRRRWTGRGGVGVLSAAFGRLNIRMLHEAFVTTSSITAVIMLIAAAAFYLNFVLGMLGVSDMLTKFVVGLNASPGQIILILGCFLDALAMVVGTIPIVFPIVAALGIDPVWFGIFLMIMAELALITLPVGMNLYVVQGERGEGNIIDVIHGVLPFLLIMLLVLPWLCPTIALGLPGLMAG